jgi:predicted 3-demethylubiquinone-9 3-methyltransferase (glyoxalase superfamily)
MQTQKMNICLWFDTQAEEAARFYTSLFGDASLGRIVRYGKAGVEVHGKPEGAVMTIEFTLNGMQFLGLNGGPHFTFNEAVSIVVNCDTQEEIDHYWSSLTADGGQEGPCGWLKDKYGVSWQINPRILSELLCDKDPDRVARVTKAFLKMKKFDIQQLVNA